MIELVLVREEITTMFSLIPYVQAAHQPLHFTGPWGIADFRVAIGCIITVIFNVGIILGTVVILVAAVMFLTSAGDKAKLATAKKALFFAVLGIAAVILARSFVNLVFDLFGVTPGLNVACPSLL